MSGIPLRLIVALLLALGCAGPALAQRWNIDSSVEAQATLTNNANYDVGAQSEGDLIFNVRPAVSFTREGSRLRVAGAASLNAVWYVDGVQTNRVLPQANILANLEAIDQLFFIEAALLANQSVLNPFLPTSAADSTFNKYTYVQGRVSPYLQGNVGNNWRYLVRSDNSYTYSTQADAQLDNAYYGRHVAEVVRVATTARRVVTGSKQRDPLLRSTRRGRSDARYRPGNGQLRVYAAIYRRLARRL